jgi:hypothetical protein
MIIKNRRGGETRLPAEEINRLRKAPKLGTVELRWAAGLASQCVDANGQPAIKVMACKKHDKSKGPENLDVYRLTIRRHPHLGGFPSIVEHGGQKYRLFAVFAGSEEVTIDQTLIADYRAVLVADDEHYMKNQDQFMSPEARRALTNPR